MQATTIARVLHAYGLPAEKVLPSEKGYRNESHPVLLVNGQRANVILYKNEPGIVATIRRIHAVSSYLAEMGFPVRRPLDNRILQADNSHGCRYLALYNYLAGHTISWEAYTQKHLKLLGKMMSDMHAGLEAFPTGNLPSAAEQYVATYERMKRYFAGNAVAEALQRKLGLSVPDDKLQEGVMILSACKSLSHQQALHMDFVRSNILFVDRANGPEISGILDFEKVAVGHPLFDIARTLAFLLVDCKYKTESQVRKYFLYSGYQKRGAKKLLRVTVRSNTGMELLLERLVDIFLLYDFYKFLRHNPYESLPENEHFVRTRDILLTRGVISTTHLV